MFMFGFKIILYLNKVYVAELIGFLQIKLL
jgi:hypothetical protein